MNVKRYATAALLVFALTAAPTAAAQAVASPTAGPAVPAGVEITPQMQTYLHSLPPAERATVIYTQLPARVSGAYSEQKPADTTALASVALAAVQGQQVTASSAGCWTGQYNGWAKATLGNTLYTWYHIGGWCVSGSTVTSASIVEGSGETSTLGWRYEGVIGSGKGIQSNEGRSFTKTKFVFGTGGWDLQTGIQCGRVRGLNNAAYYGDMKCSIYL